MASTSTKLTLKLLIDTKRKKVLFAEASKEVIDFLFSLLCLPLSTVIRLLSRNDIDMVGCIGNLYQSVEELNECYMQPDQEHKNLLLRPKLPIFSAEISALLSPDSDGGDVDPKSATSFFICPNQSSAAPSPYTISSSGPSLFSSRAPPLQSVFGTGTASSSMSGFSGSIPHTHNYVTRDRNTRCPNCSRTMNVGMHYVGNEVSKDDKFPIKNGFVKEVVTYMVMDDLVIQPMSTISSIILLNKFNVKDVGDLQEKVVQFGMTQGVNLLKASLQSKNVLTSIFLDDNGASWKDFESESH